MTYRAASVTLLVAFAFAFACGDSASDAPPSTVPPGLDASAAGDGGLGVDTGLPLSPFGLDTRPVNTTCLAPERPSTRADMALVAAFPGLTFSEPTYIAQAPGSDHRFYVVERLGKIRTFLDTATSNADVTDFMSVTVNSDNEGGFLGMAFSPNFATNRVVFISYTAPAAVPGYTTNMRSKLARVTTANGLVADGPPVTFFDVGQPYTNHNGGNIQFGPDGYLYYALGDGGAGDDPLLTGNDLSTPLGKFLRLDVSGGAGYVVPADNPFAGAPNARACNGWDPPQTPTPGPGPCREIWAYGFRNPWRWSFDRASGELWVGDVGQSTWEEIDARVTKGGDYGWSRCEGKHARGSTTDACAAPGTILPIVEHPRSEAQSITGGYVYRGSKLPALQGSYVYGDYSSGNFWRIVYDDQGRASSEFLVMIGTAQLTSFGEGNDGELYAVTASQIRKFVPTTTAPPPSAFPALLSATGCVDASDARKPAAGLVPYDLVSPLWSDGADKERFMALPEGTRITVGPDGDWQFPIGTVLMKTFSIAGQRIETRLFVRHSDGGWAGYTYEWNEAGTDAALLPAAKSKRVGTQTWTYPSRSQCLQCHTSAAGGALGPETMNMNRNVFYASTQRLAPQLDTLERIGLFDAPITVRPTMAAPSDTTQSSADRARAYLHSNCAHCHRPGGGGQGTMDLRYARTLLETATCNRDNTQGAVGAATKLIVPGDPAASLVSLRAHATDAKRMPPIAVSVTDALGTSVIDTFIRELRSCPP